MITIEKRTVRLYLTPVEHPNRLIVVFQHVRVLNRLCIQTEDSKDHDQVMEVSRLL